MRSDRVLRLKTFAFAFAVTGLMPRAAGAACTISVTGINFGSYDVANTRPVDSVGSVTYQCGPSDKDITITLSAGSSGSYSTRALLQGANRLDYNLFIDSSRTAIWGDGSAGTQLYSERKPPKNTSVTLTIYARLPGGQDVRLGFYSDLITATIIF